MDLVRSAGVMSTEELAQVLDVSAETIRRDLLSLEKKGAISRVHGGATIGGRSAVASEPSFEIRSAEELERKQRIAAVAADLVSPGSLVMIDIGTTALLVARALPPSLSATVVTSTVSSSRISREATFSLTVPAPVLRCSPAGGEGAATGGGGSTPGLRSRRTAPADTVAPESARPR